MHPMVFAVMLAIAAEGVPPVGCDGPPSESHPGYFTQGGWTLPQFEGKEFGVQFLCKGKEAIIVFQLLQSMTPEGMPVWKTLAERKVSVPKGDGLLMVSACKFKGVEDPEIVPVGHYSKSGEAKIVRAYRANRATGALEPIAAVSAVECEVEGD